MAHTRSSDFPETLETPDVGFVAAAGVYVAVTFVALGVAAALAVSGSASAVVGSVSTATPVGLVVGALLASRVEGLPERIGRRRRSQAVPFLVPVAFALASLAVLASPSVPSATAAGTGFGAFATTIVAYAIASMSRTRYARAMTPEEPTATIPRLHPNRTRRWVGGGALAIGLAVLSAFVAGDLARGRFTWWLVLVGVMAVLVGISARPNAVGSDRESSSSSRPRRRVLGFDHAKSVETNFDPDYLPELRVHEAGLVAKRPLERRLVPWADVADVRLTDDELVVERRGWVDIRCDRSVIDDPETAYEAIERARRYATGERER